MTNRNHPASHFGAGGDAGDGSGRGSADIIGLACGLATGSTLSKLSGGGAS
ncbi:MAG: hypothetical protein LBS51_03860 [Oscillospiraceae bacterium]|nr:hypothetical protein [Oscillospiraceae bacterium]